MDCIDNGDRPQNLLRRPTRSLHVSPIAYQQYDDPQKAEILKYRPPASKLRAIQENPYRTPVAIAIL